MRLCVCLCVYVCVLVCVQACCSVCMLVTGRSIITQLMLFVRAIRHGNSQMDCLVRDKGQLKKRGQIEGIKRRVKEKYVLHQILSIFILHSILTIRRSQSSEGLGGDTEQEERGREGR